MKHPKFPPFDRRFRPVLGVDSRRKAWLLRAKTPGFASIVDGKTLRNRFYIGTVCSIERSKAGAITEAPNRTVAGEATVQDLARPFSISRHLKVLEEAGLIETRIGRTARPRVVAERGFLDEVIMPHSTRQRVARALDMLRHKELANPWKKHDNIPLQGGVLGRLALKRVQFLALQGSGVAIDQSKSARPAAFCCQRCSGGFLNGYFESHFNVSDEVSSRLCAGLLPSSAMARFHPASTPNSKFSLISFDHPDEAVKMFLVSELSYCCSA